MTIWWVKDVGAAALIFGAALSAHCLPAGAQDFYQGKTLDIIVSSPPGDSYDTFSRLVGRHIGQHLPGRPPVIVRNMPGAAGIVAANHLYNVAPKDGTTIGMLDQSIYEAQLFQTSGLKADVRKMNWVGRVISNNAVLFAWHAAAVKNIDDAFSKELAVSVTGSASRVRWTVLKKVTGVKFKLIAGHQGSTEATLAMERGEVDALSMPWVVVRVLKADWLRDKKINVLLQTGLERAADLPNIPRMVDLARDNEQRQLLELFSQAEKVGRSFTSPPGLPPERVAELRAAYAATLKDQGFLAEVKTMDLVLDPLPGEELQAIVEKFFDYPGAVIEKAFALTKAD
jgi:tripartite-type tricarboxylate transporter receptor subunit TctC